MMKTIPLFLALALSGLVSLQAQSATNPATSSPPSPPAPPAPPSPYGGHGPMSILSDAERGHLKAAHDKAIQQNPVLEKKLRAAQQTLKEANDELHVAMIAVDPSVEPLLAKMMPPKAAPKREGGQGNQANPGGATSPSPSPQNTPAMTNTNAWQSPARHEPSGMAVLTENERRQVKLLHGQVQNDPAVVAAREAKQSAVTSEARNKADEDFRRAMHDAMIKADPSVEPILSKLQPRGEQPPAQPAGMLGTP